MKRAKLDYLVQVRHILRRGLALKIIHLVNHCDDIGNGIMNVATDLACQQSALGHIVCLASGGGSFVPLLQQHGVTHHVVEQPWRRPRELLWAYWKLKKIFSDFQPEIVHAHMMTGAILGRGLKRSGQFSLITTVHNEWQRSARLMAVGDRVIAVSDAVRDLMVRRGVAASKLRVVRNGPLGSPRRPVKTDINRLTLSRPAIVTVAGLYERKGIRDLLIAFADVARTHKDARLYIVGDGPDKHSFEELAQSLGCSSNVVFTGFIRDPRPYLAQADIFVLASRKDPSPLVIPEAREAGCAIVATRVDGIPEAMDGGQAGILVEPQKPQELGQILARLLSDPDERARLARRARVNLESLTLSRTMNETFTVYADALRNR